MDYYTQQLNKKERREFKKQEKQVSLGQEKNKKVIRKALGWVIGLGLLAITVFALVSYDSNIQKRVENIGGVTESDWTKGNPDAKVVLIEYSDFQCPACGAYFPIVEALNEELGDQMLFVYRHYPLTSLHPNAEPGARASEAAGKQGKFWEMHDSLFENQSSWSNLRNPKDAFIGYAEQLGLDIGQFEDDYDSGEVKDIVSDSLNEARVAGFSGTPTFIINGSRIVNNPQSLDEFRNIILRALNDAE